MRTAAPKREVTPDARRPAAVRPLLALLALFSGIALLLNIVGRVNLRAALAMTLSVSVAGLALVTWRAASPERRLLGRSIVVGSVAGFIATMAYDVSKAGLSVPDPSPYNPFHAIRIFGELLAGSSAGETAIVASGAAFHLLNGTMFGIAYVFLFARDGGISVRRALGTGVGWGVFLELFQLTLYPGWLDIRTYEEFATISALGHIVYGATLGTIARSLFRSGHDTRRVP
jgi:hypothetical protein